MAVFEWDEEKDLSNQRKHGISFKTASQVFADPLLATEQDQSANGEMRWRAWGRIGGMFVMLVAYTFREERGNDDAVECIRIISARKATPTERRRYENTLI